MPHSLQPNSLGPNPGAIPAWQHDFGKSLRPSGTQFPHLQNKNVDNNSTVFIRLL